MFARLRHTVFTIALIAIAACALILADADWEKAPVALAASNITGTSCSDIFLNRGVGDTDTTVDADDLWVGAAIARIDDPGGSFPHAVGVTSRLYLGPDLVSGVAEDYNADTVADAQSISDLVPDGPPVQVACQAKAAAAVGSPESGDLHNRTNFAAIGEALRPNFAGTYDGTTVSYGLCDFSEALGVWIRQESTITINKGTGKSTGAANLFLGTTAPTTVSPPGHAIDYTDCGDDGVTGLAFPSVLRSDERDAATDGTLETGVVADPNGPGVADTGDGLADDWDGDGCTDWDELAPYTDVNQDGNDPFNPLDCDNNVAGIAFIQVTVTPNTANNGILGILNDTVGNGTYFHCLTDTQQSGNNVTITPFCYTDSVTALVNGFDAHANNGAASPDITCLAPPPDADHCGDAREGPKPPQGSNSTANPNKADSFLAVGTRYEASASEDGAPAGSCGDDIENPGGNDANAVDQFDNDCLLGPVFDPTTLTGSVAGETATISGCFEDATGLTGPNVYVIGSFNVKTGEGTIDIWIAQTGPNCTGGTPVGAPSFDNAELVFGERNTKAGLTVTTKIPAAPPVGVGWTTAQPFGPSDDSDRDGCDDKVEITDPNPLVGGIRDPFNKWDLFDPDRNGSVAGPDFFSLLGRFGSSGDPGLDPFNPTLPASPAYHTRFDRGAKVDGSAGHVLGAANGAIAGTDFFAILGQFGTTCAAAPNPPPCTTPGKNVPQSFYESVVLQIQNPPVPAAFRNFAKAALQAWEPRENTQACWNPLATTWGSPGSTNFNSHGVKNYPNEATGVDATAKTLNLTPNSTKTAYQAIRNMLAHQSFDEPALTTALTSWSGGSYAAALISTWEQLYSDASP